MRPNNRQADALRPVFIEKNVSRYAEGSCLVRFGHTHVLCTATVEERLPPWLKGAGKGWVTAEYSMLPRATVERNRREVSQGKPSGRTQEIQRLIGRSLRTVVDLEALGERQIILDCDVLQADGGTRTAAITGAFVALHGAVTRLMQSRALKKNPILDHVAAVSCGMVGGAYLLDLEYTEDSAADVDANFVLTGKGHLIEVQVTAEKDPLPEAGLFQLLTLAQGGVKTLIDLQNQVLASE